MLIRRALAAGTAAVLLTVVGLSSSSLASSERLACKRVGTTRVLNSVELACRKVGKTLKWVEVGSRAPQEVSFFSASYSDLFGITLNWEPPRGAGPSSIIGYRLEFQTPSTPWLALPSSIPSGVYGTNIRNSELAGQKLRFRLAPISSVGVGTFKESTWVDYPPTLNKVVTAPVTTTLPGLASTTTSTTTSITSSTTIISTTSTSVSRTVSQSNAVKKAASYLRSSSFSRSGLIRQLEYEEFSSGDSEYGVDAQGADWNLQAAKKAASYLSSSSFSRSSLLSQLLYEGFTQSQAEYGVGTTGL